eukprot:RCo020076
MDAMLCVGQPGVTTVRFEVVNLRNDFVDTCLGLAPLSSCLDLQLRTASGQDLFPGSSSWYPGFALLCASELRVDHNGTQAKLPAVNPLKPGDRVELRVDRSDPEDPAGGTAVIAINGAQVAGPLALGFTEDAVVVVSMYFMGSAVQIVR